MAYWRCCVSVWTNVEDKQEWERRQRKKTIVKLQLLKTPFYISSLSKWDNPRFHVCNVCPPSVTFICLEIKGFVLSVDGNLLGILSNTAVTSTFWLVTLWQHSLRSRQSLSLMVFKHLLTSTKSSPQSLFLTTNSALRKIVWITNKQ